VSPGGTPSSAPPWRLPPALAAIGARLPRLPHSVALAAALNLLVRPLLGEDAVRAMRGRVVSLRVEDAGLDFRVRLQAIGFVPAPAPTAPDVTIRACAHDYWLLARRREDPDTLFFARRLVIEGDTELGLVVKNALDAVDWAPASFFAALIRSLSGRRL